MAHSHDLGWNGVIHDYSAAYARLTSDLGTLFVCLYCGGLAVVGESGMIRGSQCRLGGKVLCIIPHNTHSKRLDRPDDRIIPMFHRSHFRGCDFASQIYVKYEMFKKLRGCLRSVVSPSF